MKSLKSFLYFVVSARLVLFGGSHVEDEVDPSNLSNPSPILKTRPPLPSPVRPRPRSVAPDFHRRSTNLDFLKNYESDHHLRSCQVRGHGHDVVQVEAASPAPGYMRSFFGRESRPHEAHGRNCK